LQIRSVPDFLKGRFFQNRVKFTRKEWIFNFLPPERKTPAKKDLRRPEILIAVLALKIFGSTINGS